METKICSICGIKKPEIEFNIFYNTKKYKSYCKNCDKEKRKKKDLKYNTNNPDKVKESRVKYNKKNIDRLKKYDAQYRLLNADKIKEKNKKWRENTKNKPYYKIKNSITKGIQKSLKREGYSKKSHTYEILGCSFEEFRLHLESRFEIWMAWDNYGNPKDGILEKDKTWDIDHIIPLASAKTEVELLRLNHYSNLQPLCSYTNRYIKRDLI